MKKTKALTLLFTSILLIFGLNSCKKCGHCETAYGDGPTRCGEPDYDTSKEACENVAGNTWVAE